MTSFSTSLSSYLVVRATDRSVGSARRPLFGLSLCVFSGVVSGQGAKSYQKIVHCLLGDHFIHEDGLFTLIWLSWGRGMDGSFRVVTPVSLHGFVGAHSPAVRGWRVRVLRPYVWPVPPASPPSLCVSGETDPR